MANSKNIVRKKQVDYYNQLLQWCMLNNLYLRPNTEVFFVSETILMKPEFIVNEKIYVDLVSDDEMTDKFHEYCKLFSKSFGYLILIPKEILTDIHNVSKKDIEKKYNINF